MSDYMGVKEAMARLNKSDASIRRYMRDGDIRFTKASEHKYAPVLLLRSDVEQLRIRQEQERRLLETIHVTTSHDYEERIAWLEGKVLEMEGQIRELQNKSAKFTDLAPTELRTRPATKSRSQSALPDLPEGWIAWQPLVLSHGLRPDVIDKRDYVNAGEQYKLGRSRILHPVDPSGQSMFIQAYRANPKFHQCERETCPCRY